MKVCFHLIIDLNTTKNLVEDPFRKLNVAQGFTIKNNWDDGE